MVGVKFTRSDTPISILKDFIMRYPKSSFIRAVHRRMVHRVVIAERVSFQDVNIIGPVSR